MQVILILCLGFILKLNAATIAIIDSGVDFSHEALQGSEVQGWNFAEGNDRIFTPTSFSFSDLKEFREVVARSNAYGGTEDEGRWVEEHLKLPGFKEDLERFSSHVHGTHVAAIAKGDYGHRIMAVKVAAPLSNKSLREIIRRKLGEDMAIPEDREDQDELLDFLLRELARQAAASMKEVVTYVGEHGAGVGNLSIGFSVHQARSLVGPAFVTIHHRQPRQDDIVRWTMLLLKEMVLAQELSFRASPQTLFVFAAGNDSLFSDSYPGLPGSVKLENTITVAATHGDFGWAPFSNYGLKSVEVAAPGVLIPSSIPGNDVMEMSGTSQAAPYVSAVAGKIRDVNALLTPAQVKRILMETVDKKDFLRFRVASGGIVNPERALEVAFLSRIISLDEALERVALFKKNPI